MTEIEGFYATYLTGSDSQGFAMLVFRAGIIVGVDAAGVTYDGSYQAIEKGFDVKLAVTIPPNTLLVQGFTSGPHRETSELRFSLPVNFASLLYLRINGKHGPVNARLTKLRNLQ